MATVEYFDGGDYSTKESIRDYESLGHVQFIKHAAWEESKVSSRELFLDTVTGLVVMDIKSFEQWIR